MKKMMKHSIWSNCNNNINCFEMALFILLVTIVAISNHWWKRAFAPPLISFSTFQFTKLGLEQDCPSGTGWPRIFSNMLLCTDMKLLDSKHSPICSRAWLWMLAMLIDCHYFHLQQAAIFACIWNEKSFLAFHLFTWRKLNELLARQISMDVLTAQCSCIKPIGKFSQSLQSFFYNDRTQSCTWHVILFWLQSSIWNCNWLFLWIWQWASLCFLLTFCFSRMALDTIGLLIFWSFNHNDKLLAISYEIFIFL